MRHQIESALSDHANISALQKDMLFKYTHLIIPIRNRRNSSSSVHSTQMECEQGVILALVQTSVK